MYYNKKTSPTTRRQQCVSDTSLNQQGLLSPLSIESHFQELQDLRVLHRTPRSRRGIVLLDAINYIANAPMMDVQVIARAVQERGYDHLTYLVNESFNNLTVEGRS